MPLWPGSKVWRQFLVLDRRLCFFLVLSFILATIVGTQTHELGHYLAAKCVGVSAQIHIGYTSVVSGTEGKTDLDYFWFTLGGPLQTMLTGTLGLLWIYLKRASFRKDALTPGQWGLVFMALFWMRQPMNLATGLAKGLHPKRGDEVILARMLDLPVLSISLLTALVGVWVSYVVIFKYIPLKQRLTFLASGLAGGLAGYAFWIIYLMDLPGK